MLLLANLSAVTPAIALEVRVTVERLEAGAMSASGLQADLAWPQLQLHAAQMTLPGGWTLADARFECSLSGEAAQEACAGAAWSFHLVPGGGAWRLPLAGHLTSLVRSDAGWEAGSTLTAGDFRAELRAEAGSGRVAGTLRWVNQPLDGVMQLPVAPDFSAWIQAGATSGTIGFLQDGSASPRVDYAVSLAQLAFDSPDGRYAAAGLGLSLRGSVRSARTMTVRGSAEVTTGELLVDRFYTSFDQGPVAIEAEAVLDGPAVEIRSVRISDGRTLELAAAAQFDRTAPLDSITYRIEHLELHFPGAYERYFENLLAPLTLDKLTVTGSVLWRGSGRSRAFPEGELDVLDLSIVDRERGRFAVTGLEAQLRAGDSPTDSRIAWRGLLLQRINLGAGEGRVRTRPGAFELAEPLKLDVLGGRLSLDRLAVVLPPQDAAPGAEPEISLQASLDGMEMSQLTDALEWPRFEGRISGVIPGVSLEAGVLAVEGRIEFDVFDGQLELSGLRIERPFGVLPSLAANLEVRDIDLQLFTQAFSFGRISGRMDGYLRDLRMLDWKPVAFDAWFGTPARQSGSNAISRQAVNHLTSIGGGGATAALTSPLMRLFNNFSYRRLGMGCRLENYVCELRGLEDDGQSVLILEGAGVPKIMIRAYNRRMDFPQLVANLAAASAGESVRIGD